MKRLVSVLGPVAVALSLFAQPGLAQTSKVLNGPLLQSMPASALPMNTQIITFNVANILSFDERGDEDNQVFNLMVGAGAEMVGIGWDVTLFGKSPSWLSELSVSFGSTDEPYRVFLSPGGGPDGDQVPGTASYSSDGIVDLVDQGLNFNVGADGKLRLEFYEGFDDLPDEWDGRWESGTLSIQINSPIPEPSTYGLMALGLVGLAAAGRRRKA
jgi:PEP-CTERM motif